MKSANADVHNPRSEGLWNPLGSVPPGGDTMDLVGVACSTANVMVTASDADDRLAWARWIHALRAHRHGGFVAVAGRTTRQVRAADVDEWFGRATRGTLFIDCVGDLAADVQARLNSVLSARSRGMSGLRVPIGDDGVRVITGNRRSLHADLALGVFDHALFYRLNVIHIDLICISEATRTSG